MSLASAPDSDGASLRVSLALLVSRTPLLQAGRHRWTLASQGHPQHPGPGSCHARSHGPLDCAASPMLEPHPVALRRVVVGAVGDLRLATVQDAPDDGNAGHLFPATDQVLRLLEGHDPAGCRERGQWSGGPSLSPFSTPALPPAQPSPEARCQLVTPTPPLSEEGRGRQWKILPEKVERSGTVSGQRKEARRGHSPRGGPESKEQVGGQLERPGCKALPTL